VKSFEDFDVSALWVDTEYSRSDYVGESLSPSLVQEVEHSLGYKLPTSYIELMYFQNGGLLAKTVFRSPSAYVLVNGIYGITHRKRESLGGVQERRNGFVGRNPRTGEPIEVGASTYQTGSHFWVQQWGYPPIGVYFADCPSGRHDMICLDYRACGPIGEPKVVHVAQESDFTVTFLAPTFEAFIRGLE
jgi:hypothetical protein